MKDQYVGDLNDFAKYQLLRLCATVFEQIVVAWMLTPGDGRGDGGRIGYLAKAGWRESDPELYDGLAELVFGGRRNVAAVEAAGLLPQCSFASGLVPPASGGRSAYFESIAAEAGAGTLVFFDPDNGLDVASTPRHRRGAEKYLYLEELAQFAEKDASLLVYQHFPRVPRDPYIDRTLERLRAGLGENYLTFAAHTSNVAFLFAVREPEARPLHATLALRCRESRLLSFRG